MRSHSTFYWAQGYRDIKLYTEAIAHCLKRSVMGGWQYEVYCSLDEVGQLKQQLELPDVEVLADDEVLAAYSQAMPSRIEALHDDSRLCRLKGRFQEGYLMAKRGLGKYYLSDSLFIRTWI